MIVSDHARMLAVAPGGWDRCLCRSCRPYHLDLARTARRLEHRLLADEIAGQMEAAREDEAFFSLADAINRSIVAEDHADECEVEWYWEQRAMEDLIDLGATCGCEHDPDNFAVAADVWNGTVYCWECI